VALTIAFFVNAAILLLAAMVFFGKESVTPSRVSAIVVVEPPPVNHR
jgi:Mn2+/Fe2+ NRAMP family transporter